MKEADFLTLSEEILRKGCNLRTPIMGFSMLPSLMSGDITFIRPVNVAKIEIGDIIVRCAGQKMVAHRVIKKCREEDKMVLVTKGDAILNSDAPLREDCIMGKVITIEKSNGAINLECKVWRIANYIIARYSLLSLLIYGRICLLKRVFMGNRKNRLLSFGPKVLSISLSLFPKLLINFLFTIQHIKSKLKPT